ncbi:MAG: TraB/VirB10 family protein [Gammaproteobacteria bacterium]|nr:TraB/VirB10 family protein [Gammaproteobacteria bacterium]
MRADELAGGKVEQLREKWDQLTPQRKTFFLKWGSGLGIFLAILASYYWSGRDERVVEEVVQVDQIDLGTGMLEDDIRAEVDAKLTDVELKNQDDDQRLMALETLMTELQNKDILDKEIELGSKLDSDSDEDPYGGVSDPRSPYPPAPAVFPQQAVLTNAPPVEVQFVGAVSRSVGIPVAVEDDGGKKKTQFLMPPGFMESKLLTGVEALTSAQGKEDAEPLMFRVQAPAILPNDLKADLKGCFVVGNAYGSLARERVMVRLVSLHCVALDGTGVIDEEIKGFVTGKDGKKGLPGIVVTKMGSLIARAAVAGIADGIGQAITLDTVTQSVNPLGATNVVDPDKAFQAGIGQGIKTGSEKIQELYLELARQSGPVIESGASADCTIVIQESVVLNIKDWRGKGNALL